ncbi:MAG: hypothetical protein ABIA75_00755, partial [Candidatus Neomarinimicrobiota bacterium]
QYTAGVSGLRLRYDCASNAGIWLWGVYDKFEFDQLIDDVEQHPQYGGRLVIPLGPGELAFAYNQSSEQVFKKNFGIDGTWDIGVGLWFEMGLTNTESFDDYDWLSQLTLGTDYTFGIGNGITVTGEYFLVDYSEVILGNDDQTGMFGVMGTYPVSIMDNLSLISIYYPDGDLFYNYYSWQRTWDNWLIQVGAYLLKGAESFFLNPTMGTVGTMGLQLNLVFNH